MAPYGGHYCVRTLNCCGCSLSILDTCGIELISVLHSPVIRVKVKGQTKCEGCRDEASKAVRLKYLSEDGCTLT
jgi:hypothetical protein